MEKNSREKNFAIRLSSKKDNLNFHSHLHVLMTDYSVVDRIINHLKLSFTAERPPPPQVSQQQLCMAAEARSEYFS